MTRPPVSTQVIAPNSPTSPKTVNQGPSSPHEPKSAISNGTIQSISSPQGVTPSSFAPSVRHPLSRPLSPDLPSRDALYLFCNFSSYMRSPQEGADGIKTSEDFRDTTRLLDYARALSNHAHSNVHVCHLKYRFQGQTQTFRSPYATGDYQLPLNYRDSTGRLRNPVPQPFSTLHDEVIKIDYKENGVFQPLPAQAIFDHIAKKCQPPPRIIVISYVCSKVTENHLAAFSTWARTSSPPCYVFSPLETRIREKRPLRLALHHAIPMSMYAWPADYTLNTSPSSGSITPALPIRGRRTSAPTITTGAHIINQALSRGHQDPILIQSDSHPERQYPSDPVASLTVVGADEVIPVDQSFESKGSIASQSTVDRIPLWALAPGVGVLHGSTSASIGVKLSDFSAIALTEDTASKRTSSTGQGVITREEAGIKMTSIDMRSLVDQPIPPVEAPNRPNTPSKALAQMAKSIRPGRDRVAHYKETHLSPPEAAKPAVHLSPLSRTTSWPGSVNKVPGWKKGRKEQMADTLEALAICEDPVNEVALGLRDLSTSDHDGRGDGQDSLFGVL